MHLIAFVDFCRNCGNLTEKLQPLRQVKSESVSVSKPKDRNVKSLLGPVRGEVSLDQVRAFEHFFLYS